MTNNRLKDLMAARDLTQEQLAAMAGLQQSHVSKLVNGKGSPSLNTAAKVASALGVTVEDVWPKEAESKREAAS